MNDAEVTAEAGNTLAPHKYYVDTVEAEGGAEARNEYIKFLQHEEADGHLDQPYAMYRRFIEGHRLQAEGKAESLRFVY